MHTRTLMRESMKSVGAGVGILRNKYPIQNENEKFITWRLR